MVDIETRRASICKNRGGWADATDGEINALWMILPEDIKKEYSESIRKKKERSKNAVSTGPNTNV